MQRSLLSALAAAAVVFAAPALLLYAHSDVGGWSGFLERLITSAPVAFSAAAFAYVVILGVTGNECWLRVAVAGLLCLCLPFGTVYLAQGLLFGLGESDAGPIIYGIVVAVLSLPTAIAHVAVLSKRKWRILEFLAYPATAILALAIPPVGQSSWFVDATLFALWPKTFAATPFALLAAFTAAGASLRPIALAGVIALVPLYALKAAIDWQGGHGWRAAIWPARVQTEFIGAQDRFAATNQAYRAIAAGEPVCIGAHRYRFKSAKNMGQGPSTLRTPGCLTFVHIDVSAEALDIAAVANGDVRVIIGVSRSPQQRATNPLAINEGDLIVSMLLPRGSSARSEQHELLRDKLRQYIRSAQLPPAS
jgi:hypothetical protein